MQETDIIQKLSEFPRTRFLHLPTPLERLERFSREIGLPHLYIKRDDCTGLGGGGNKTRKLQYVVGEAASKGADTLITTGTYQSNHARQTAAFAAKLGMDCHLALLHVLTDPPQEYFESGNILLDKLLGAKIHEAHLEPSGFSKTQDESVYGSSSDDLSMEDIAENIREQGGNPYIVNLGASTPIGALGYAECAAELTAQAKSDGKEVDWVVHACGSCGTQAGLLAGFKALGASTRVVGIAVDGTTQLDKIEAVKFLAQEALALLGSDARIEDEDIIVNGDYVTPGYGQFGDNVRRAITSFLQSEGIPIDPIYTGKAVAGLMDLADKDYFKPSERIVFLHTGGWPGLFAYASRLMAAA